MRKVRDNTAGAVGYGVWRWKCPETGLMITHSNYRGEKLAVKQYLRANNFPITGNFDEEFEENLCANGVPALCVDFTAPTLIQKMGTLAQSLARWANSGFKVRTPEEVNDILNNKCKPCSFYGGQTGVLKIACVKCGCSKLKLYLTSSHCPLAEPKW